MKSFQLYQHPVCHIQDSFRGALQRGLSVGLQQPFPDWYDLYRMVIRHNLRLVVTGDDVTVIVREGFQELDQSAYFALVGCLIIQIVRYLDGQPRRGNAEINLRVLVEIIEERFFSRVSEPSVQLNRHHILQQFRFALKQEQIEYTIVCNVSFLKRRLFRHW